MTLPLVGVASMVEWTTLEGMVVHASALLAVLVAVMGRS